MNVTKGFPSTVPNVFLYQDADGILKTVAHVHGVETLFGQPVRAWDNSNLAFGSDVVHGQVGMVLLPESDFFATVRELVVPTIANTLAAITALQPNDSYLGPYDEVEPNTELLQARRAVPIPHCYIALVYNKQFTAREAWNQVAMQIIYDDRTIDCAVLLNFLCVAMVLPPQIQGRPRPIVPPTALPERLTAPVADADLLSHQHRLLQRLLPSLSNRAGAGGLEHQMLQTNIAIQNSLQAQAAAQLQQDLALGPFLAS
jgi:hypothetical protein